MAKFCCITFLLAFGILQIFSQPIENDVYRQPYATLNVIERIRRNQPMSEDQKKRHDARLTDVARIREEFREQQIVQHQLTLINIAQRYLAQGLDENQARLRARADRPDLARAVDDYQNHRQG